jgi:hypothetical protein
MEPFIAFVLFDASVWLAFLGLGLFCLGEHNTANRPKDDYVIYSFEPRFYGW